ncbi:MAG: TatD family hydrolase [Sphaerochaetaceae bacterium]
MQLFDTHAHIGLIEKDQLEQLMAVQKAKIKGVRHMVSICNSLPDFERTYANLKSQKDVFHAVGVSPTMVQNPGKNWEEKVSDYAKLPNVIAIGETGLDYFHREGEKNDQIELFLKSLEIAKHLDLPVIIHNRMAGSDILSILKEKLPARGGILHCFGEDMDFAREALDLNLTFSFAGNVTFPNSNVLRRIAATLPSDRIVIESEAPFIAPVPHQNQRNQLCFLVETAQCLAQLRGVDIEDLAPVLYQNSLKAFNLDSSV